MHRPNRRRRPDGFTLIELLIVVAIIGIIAAIAVPALAYAIDKAKQRATLSDIRSLAQAITQYYLDNSFYPNPGLTPSQLQAQLTKYAGDSLRVQDRWSNDLGYASDRKNYYSIESYGRDGLDGANITVATRNDFNLDIVFDTSQFVASPEP